MYQIGLGAFIDVTEHYRRIYRGKISFFPDKYTGSDTEQLSVRYFMPMPDLGYFFVRRVSNDPNMSV